MQLIAGRLCIHIVSQQTGNAETEGRQLVGGFGATMMLHATISALSQMILDVCVAHIKCGFFSFCCVACRVFVSPSANFAVELHIELPSSGRCTRAASIL